MNKFSYKSFCWSLGTTSFRTADFNLKIERQLALLDEFKRTNCGNWQEQQFDYYYFIQEKKFVSGNAARPDKDAREKTSGLVDIGLIDMERNLTEVGKKLLKISQKGDFTSNNILQISNDSFIYLKQLLKMSCNVDGNIVRPYIVLVYILSKVEYLTEKEFTYLLPLCVDKKTTEKMIKNLNDIRKNNSNFDKYISEILLGMENYKSALKYFLFIGKVSENNIVEIGLNRKSGDYDRPYFNLFNLLKKIVFETNNNCVLDLLKQCNKIKGKTSSIWLKYLFSDTTPQKIKREKLNILNNVPIFNCKTEQDFKKEFFKLLHLFKAKATLSDYSDLNERYFKTTDTIIFEDGIVKLDTIPKCWLEPIAEKLFDSAFEICQYLDKDIDLEQISFLLKVNENKLFSDIENKLNIKIRNKDDINSLIFSEKYKRFNKLIDEKFTKEIIIDLFNKFEKRDDDNIRKIVTNNADIPTIFEYIIGISWYIISERKGDILKYMNLSFEANMLPKTHAIGGCADIEYQYEKTQYYPEHCLLIEATLSEGSSQHRMESEPISRHLGEYILKMKDNNAYCVLIATKLYNNIISDFRNKKTYKYFSDSDFSELVDGLKIIPLQISEIKSILSQNILYNDLFKLFENAFKSQTAIPIWYENEIKLKIEGLNQ